jgi:glycosyltransferase involved in cell wall biosynthesis
MKRDGRAELRRVALVTEELSTGNGSGGIGGAFHELALALARHGLSVEIFFVPPEIDQKKIAQLAAYYSAYGVALHVVDVPVHSWSIHAPEHRSYAVLCELRALEEPFDFIHFHDYKGLGFFVTAAKRQGLGFAKTALVMQLHGPTRWTLEANGFPFTHEDQLKVDFMERESIARADIVVSPSAYLLSWVRQKKWALPSDEFVRQIQNVCTQVCAGAARARPEAGVQRFKEIVFFGRHEERKGLAAFCDALDLLSEEFVASGVVVTFLGRFGQIAETPSPLYLARRAANWRFALRMLPDFGRDDATRYLRDRSDALVVIPSPCENSPYTVFETVVLGKPLITSDQGGARELLDPASAEKMTCRISGVALAAKIRQVLADGLPAPALNVAPEATERAWVALHEKPVPTKSKTRLAATQARPLVTLAIVHHDRPEKLFQALLSAAAQTYAPVELLVVDDGSRDTETHRALQSMAPFFAKLDARLIRQENLYLGAARNRAAREARGDYLLFLDDDDLLFPQLLQTLVPVAETTRADAVQCLNLFMEEHRRGEAFPFPDRFKQKVSYVPLGGPLALAPLENCFGSATALIRRSSFELVGGYTELHGVGHEDYEIYVRMLQKQMRVEVCAMPLYLYEVGRPSMISLTSKLRNFQRVAGAIEAAGFDGTALSDLASLAAGRRALEHAENARIYATQISPHAELLGRLHYTPQSSPAYADLLAELAGEMGAESYAAALRALKAARLLAENKPVEATAQPLVKRQAARAKRVSEPLLLAAMIDMECGRIPEAAMNFGLFLERREELGHDGIQFLQRLLRQKLPDPKALRGLTARVGNWRLTDTKLRSDGQSIFRLALVAGDWALAEALATRIVELDERDYLETYADVAAAVIEGGLNSGVAHHASHPDENRAGFEAATALCEALRDECGLFSRPDTLLAQLAAQRSPPVRAEAA